MTTNAVVRNALERAGLTVAKNGLDYSGASDQLMRVEKKAKKDIERLLYSITARIDKYSAELSEIERQAKGAHAFDQIQNYVGAMTGDVMKVDKYIEAAKTAAAKMGL